MVNLRKYFDLFKKSQNKNLDLLDEADTTLQKEKPSVRFAQWQADFLNQNTQQSLLERYAPYQAPPGVRGMLHEGGSRQIIMDCALSETLGLTQWASESLSPQEILKSSFEDGLLFLGYPTLAEMANRPELRKPCHVIAREALREWISIHAIGGETTEKTPERIKAIEREFTRLNIRSLMQKMAEQSLLYGIAHLWISLEGEGADSGSQSVPLALTPNGMEKNSLKELRLIEPIWMTPNSYRADNPLAFDYYRPEHWWVQGVLVHHSRLIQMVPYEVSDLLKPSFNFGGLSLTQQLKPYTHNYLRIRNSVANIVANFSKLVLQTDMAANMSVPENDFFGGSVDASGLTGRAKLLQALSEGQDTIIADKESEDIKIISTPLGGLDALQSQSQEAQAAIPGIPLVKLFGVTPKGLNASSEGEIRVFYDEIKSFQQANLRPALEIIFRLCQLNLWGEIDPSLSFDFEPLWQLDPQEKTALEKSKADIDALNIKNNIISPSEARIRQQAEADSIYGSVDLSKPLPEPAQTAPAGKNGKNAPEAGGNPATAEDAEWEESKHPRHPNGQFAPLGEGAGGTIAQAAQTMLHGAGSLLNALNPIGSAEAAEAESELSPSQALRKSGSKLSRSAELEADLDEARAKAAAPQADENAMKDLMTEVQAHPRIKGLDVPNFLTGENLPSGAPSKEKVADWMREWGNGWMQGNDTLFNPKDLDKFADKDHFSLSDKQADLDEKMQQRLNEAWSDPKNRMMKNPDGKIAELSAGAKGNEAASLQVMQEGMKNTHLGQLENGMDVFMPSGFQQYYDQMRRKKALSKGIGLAHMEANHGQQYRNFGFENAEHYAQHVFNHADQLFHDPEKNNSMLVLGKDNPHNPSFGKIAPNGESAAEDLNLIIQSVREGKYGLLRTGFPMGPNNNEVLRKGMDLPEIQDRMRHIHEIADHFEKIENPEVRRAYLSAASHFFHDAPASATIKDAAEKQPYQFRKEGKVFGAEGLKNVLVSMKDYLSKAGHDVGKTLSEPLSPEGEKTAKNINRAIDLVEAAGMATEAATGLGAPAAAGEMAVKAATQNLQKKAVSGGVKIASKIGGKLYKTLKNGKITPEDTVGVAPDPEDPEEPAPEGAAESGLKNAVKGAEAAAGVSAAAAGAGAIAKAAGGKLGAVSKLVSEISKPMKSGTMETAESAAKRVKNPKPWESENGDLIGKPGDAKNQFIREMPRIHGAEKDVKIHYDTIKQDLLSDGYKPEEIIKQSTPKGDVFEREDFEKDSKRVTLNIRKDTSQSSKNAKGTVTMDIHNHPDILEKHGVKRIKLKFLP